MKTKRSPMLKKIAALALAVVLTVGWAVPAFAANVPYRGYTYNHWGVFVPGPVAYVPVRTFMAQDIRVPREVVADIDVITLGTRRFNEAEGYWFLYPERDTPFRVCPDSGEFFLADAFVDPQAMRASPCGHLLVVDTMNSRIVIFNMELELVRIIDGFDYHGVFSTLNQPRDVFVTWDREIFIADTWNERVVVLDWDGNYVTVLYGPGEDELIDEFLFRPTHVLVDRGGRIYVNVMGVFEGLMNFNADGDFLGYFGTITVSVSAADLFWRIFMSEEQRARQARVIPTTFQSIALDEHNFVFTTNLEAWGANQVMRLNPRGEDVLVNMNPQVNIAGDQRFRAGGGPLSGPSQFTDIVARPAGMYTALDSTRGRVYTYDNEGNLLYVFAGIGQMIGMQHRPRALTVLDDYIFVMDAHFGRVVQFAPTEYGALINEAIRLRYEGDEDGAIAAWRRLVEIDEHFQLAWAGIGRGMLAEGDNVRAMYYLRRGMDMMHYSIAFRRHRMDVMQDLLPTIFTWVSVAIGLFVAYKVVKTIRKRVAAA